MNLSSLALVSILLLLCQCLKIFKGFRDGNVINAKIKVNMSSQSLGPMGKYRFYSTSQHFSKCVLRVVLGVSVKGGSRNLGNTS